MRTHELIELLHEQAKEVSREQINGWGNTMTLAAETLQKYMEGIDAIYNHNEAARAAVIQHSGLWHRAADSANAESSSGEGTAKP